MRGYPMDYARCLARRFGAAVLPRLLKRAGAGRAITSTVVVMTLDLPERGPERARQIDEDELVRIAAECRDVWRKHERRRAA